MTYYIFLLFLLVPILVHLFHFRRVKKTYFSSLSFITQSLTQTKQQSRLKHLLILSCRILSFLFIILAISVPLFYRSKAENESVAFYLDNSPSQTVSDRGITFLNQNKELIPSIASMALNGIELLTNDESYSFSTQHDLENGLDDVHTSFNQQSFFAVLNQLKLIEKESLFLMSDFQHINSNEIDVLIEDTSRNYYLIPKQWYNRSNVWVDTLRFQDVDNTFSEIKTFIDLKGNLIDGDPVVKIYSDGQLLSSLNYSMSDANPLEVDLPRTKSLQYTIELSGDDIKFDNNFFFLAPLDSKITIGIISENDNKYIKEVFGNATIFKVLEFAADNIAFDELSNLDLLVLNGLNIIPSVLTDVFDNGYIIVPPTKINTESYEQFLGLKIDSMKNPNKEQLLIEKANPLIQSILNVKNENYNLPEATPLLSVNGSFEELLSTISGQSLVIKQSNKVLFTGPLGNEYSNFGNHSLFLPIMYQLCFELNKNHSVAYFYPSDVLSVKSNQKDVPFKMIAKNYERVPDITLNGDLAEVKIPDNMSPGFYYLTQGADTLVSFAVNLRKSESQFSMDGRLEKLREYADKSHITILNESELLSTGETFSLSENDMPLWKIALALSVIFLVAEALLLRLFK